MLEVSRVAYVRVMGDAGLSKEDLKADTIKLDPKVVDMTISMAIVFFNCQDVKLEITNTRGFGHMNNLIPVTVNGKDNKNVNIVVEPFVGKSLTVELLNLVKAYLDKVDNPKPIGCMS